MTELEKIIDDFKGHQLDKDKALKYILWNNVHNKLKTKDIVGDSYIFYPDMNITLLPRISELTDQTAVVDFYISAPNWEDYLLDSTIGMGETAVEAIDMATSSFLWSFMEKFMALENNEKADTIIETEFMGNTHRWKIYFGNIVAFGEKPEFKEKNPYWNILKDELVKRLGNQKNCYVKLNLSNIYGTKISECQINQIDSKELGALFLKIVEEWDDEKFTSQIMTFFVSQEKATVNEYEYWGKDGKEKIKNAITKAVQLVMNCEDKKQYKDYLKILKKELNDKTLAEECYYFLPEICAENAFKDASFPEYMMIQVNKNPLITIYKAQLTDYTLIKQNFFELLDSSVFAKNKNNIYSKYILFSNTYSELQNMKKDNENLKIEEVAMEPISYSVSKDFKIR